VGFGLISLAACAAGYFLIRGATEDGHAQELNGAKENVLPMFVGWNKPPPDLAIVVSGEMHGYLQPCGCSRPQKGGLARRYNFIESLRKKWPVAAVDLGDVAQSSGPQQRLKYVVAMKSLKLMGYQAVGIGKNEFLMPLTDALAHYSINEPEPRPLAANLIKTDPKELFHDLNVRKGELFMAGPFKVGVLGAIGTNTAAAVQKSLPPNEKDIRFLDHQQILPGLLKHLGAKKNDLGILLYQGSESEAASDAVLLHKAHLANPAVAPVQIIVCSSEDSEPPAFPKRVPGAPDTLIVTTGHKGRYVGVVGVWKKGAGVELKYQLVPIDPEYQTKPGEKNNPVSELIQKYAEEVRDGNYLARFPRDNHEVQTVHKNARYVGSKRCGDCHEHAFKVWQASEHAKAFQRLVAEKNPSLRQYDGECVACHTVGYKHHTGYYDPPPGANAQQIQKHNLKLQDVGCESCHGPASNHVDNVDDKTIYPIINPYRPSEKELNPATPVAEKGALRNRRMSIIERRLCISCHDMENDVHWGEIPFAKKWEQIAHPTPKKDAKAAGK
jgi:hypothetical protein